ncbi:CPBP family glutamic-type intramembrane protease [Rosettibacter primus]|uniref:CPBP family glutamic-type intramembrane protease n=1 Tax=Rosettibacter primus TaxID=3111523 RepID=UPI003EB8CEEF
MNTLLWANYILFMYYLMQTISHLYLIRWAPFLINSYLIRIIFAFLEIILLSIGLYNIKIGGFYIIITSPFIAVIYLPLIVLLTSPSFQYFVSYRYRFWNWIKFIVTKYLKTIKILLQTLKEELIWRSAFVVIATILGISNILIVIIGSLMFYFIHWEWKKKIILLQEFELWLFSLLLYMLFLYTNSLLAVWIIHFIRNSYLIFHNLNVKRRL